MYPLGVCEWSGLGMGRPVRVCPHRGGGDAPLGLPPAGPRQTSRHPHPRRVDQPPPATSRHSQTTGGCHRRRGGEFPRRGGDEFPPPSAQVPLGDGCLTQQAVYPPSDRWLPSAGVGGEEAAATLQ